MKSTGFNSSRATVGVVAALIALPASVSAQAIVGYRRPSTEGQATTSAPAQSVQVQAAPIRSGFVFARPSGSMPPVSITTNSSTFRNQRPSGPVVVLPEASGHQYDSRHYGSWPQPSWSGGTGDTYTNNSYTNNFLPPIGPANGFFTHPIPPIGPANGFFNSTGVSNPVFPSGPDVRMTSPYGPQEGGRWRVESHYYNYDNGSAYSQTVIGAAPALLGGYYYGSYCDNAVPSYTYPSVYSSYDGFPRYLYNPTVVVVSTPYIPAYETPFMPFYTPSYPVSYNQTNYYVTNESRVQDLEAGGERARTALNHAYPADSYQAAFGDIARAWMDSTSKPLRKHIRDSDTRISVFLDKKYSYSIAPDDFVQITRDALDRLNTVSFDFTRLRKAKNGDVTAYGIHVYRVGGADTTTDSKDGDTVPFDQSGPDSSTASPYAKANDPSHGAEKTVYVSYTLRRHDTQWYIIAIDSSDQELVPGN
jgi:hypothetical protein